MIIVKVMAKKGRSPARKLDYIIKLHWINLKKQIAVAKVNAQRAATIEAQTQIEK